MALALGGCACLLATVPCPLSLLGRRGLPENEPLFPGPAASSCPRRAARQTKAEPDVVGRRLDLLPSSRSRSNPAGRQADRQTDARLGGMGRDTPIFSRFCIPTPFLPWAKNTRAGWTGKIITIKELSRRCVQLFPRLLALPFGQDRSPSPAMDDSTLHPHPSTLHPHPSFPISPHPLSAQRTLPHPCRPAPRLLQGCIPHPLTVPSPMPHQPWGPTPFS